MDENNLDEAKVMLPSACVDESAIPTMSPRYCVVTEEALPQELGSTNFPNGNSLGDVGSQTVDVALDGRLLDEGCMRDAQFNLDLDHATAVAQRDTRGCDAGRQGIHLDRKFTTANTTVCSVVNDRITRQSDITVRGVGGERRLIVVTPIRTGYSKTMGTGFSSHIQTVATENKQLLFDTAGMVGKRECVMDGKMS